MAAQTRATTVAHELLPVAKARAGQTLDAQLAIAQIPAPSGAEAARASWVKSALQQAGHMAEIDVVGNVLAHYGNQLEPPVVVCAHLDTVFAATVPHRIDRLGARYVCPGIGDNARGLAALVTLANIIPQVLPPTSSILFAATVGEEGEGDLRGARQLFAARAGTARAVVNLDGPGDSRIVTHAVGAKRYRVEFTGSGGHSWVKRGTPNALHAAAFLAHHMSLLSRDHAWSTVGVAVTQLHGGTAVNAIPARAVVDVEFRATDAQRLADVATVFRDSVERARQSETAPNASYSALTAAITVTSDRPAAVIATHHPLVVAACAASAGIGRDFEFASGSSDGNVPLSLGIPTVTIGAGGHGGEAHTPHEWYDDTEGHRGIARACAVVIAATRLGP